MVSQKRATTDNGMSSRKCWRNARQRFMPSDSWKVAFQTRSELPASAMAISSQPGAVATHASAARRLSSSAAATPMPALVTPFS